MNGHVPMEHRTNSGAVVILCECGWRTAPRGVYTRVEGKRKVVGLDTAREVVLREHGAHVAAVKKNARRG